MPAHPPVVTRTYHILGTFGEVVISSHQDGTDVYNVMGTGNLPFVLTSMELPFADPAKDNQIALGVGAGFRDLRETPLACLDENQELKANIMPPGQAAFKADQGPGSLPPVNQSVDGLHSIGQFLFYPIRQELIWYKQQYRQGFVGTLRIQVGYPAENYYQFVDVRSAIIAGTNTLNAPITASFQLGGGAYTFHLWELVGTPPLFADFDYVTVGAVLMQWIDAPSITVYFGPSGEQGLYYSDCFETLSVPYTNNQYNGDNLPAGNPLNNNAGDYCRPLGLPHNGQGFDSLSYYYDQSNGRFAPATYGPTWVMVWIVNFANADFLEDGGIPSYTYFRPTPPDKADSSPVGDPNHSGGITNPVSGNGGDDGTHGPPPSPPSPSGSGGGNFNGAGTFSDPFGLGPGH